MLQRLYSLLVLVVLAFGQVMAQDETQEQPQEPSAVVYEIIYDEPFAVNKLFIHFQPVYGELFKTNVNIGFGLKADYYFEDKADFSASFRKSYSRQFFDLARDQAFKNSDVDNTPEIFNYYELGGTYHVKDFEVSSHTKMVLYKDSLRGNKWAAHVPGQAIIPCKVRQIYGARLGGILWDSNVDIGRVLEQQGMTNADLMDTESNPLPGDVKAFSSISSAGLYVGASLAWIRNVAVSFDSYDDGVDDMILTTYLDLLFAPSIKLDDIAYAQQAYSTEPIEIKKIGFRAGVEGKFNRKFGWSYGGELGYRPGIAGMSFFALVKIGVPVFGHNLNYEVEAFEK